jgi:hypothetical protein
MARRAQASYNNLENNDFPAKSSSNAGPEQISYPPDSGSVSLEELSLAMIMGRLSQSLSGFSSSSFYLPLLVVFGGAGLSLHGLSFCMPFALGLLVGARLMSIVTPTTHEKVLDSPFNGASVTRGAAYDSGCTSHTLS